MARWRPDAPQRLMAAALELFEERGYDHTTVQEITERAGLTKSAFFRHFANKREVLFETDALAAALVAGVDSAPAGVDAWTTLMSGIAGAGETFMTAERHDLLARRAVVIAGTSELLEREALKRIGLVAALVEAMTARGVPHIEARVTCEIGALAFAIAYERWLASTAGESFADLLGAAEREVRTAARRSAGS